MAAAATGGAFNCLGSCSGSSSVPWDFQLLLMDSKTTTTEIEKRRRRGLRKRRDGDPSYCVKRGKNARFGLRRPSLTLKQTLAMTLSLSLSLSKSIVFVSVSGFVAGKIG